MSQQMGSCSWCAAIVLLRPGSCRAPGDVGDEQRELRRDARRRLRKQQLQRQRAHGASLRVRQARVRARGHRLAPAAPHSVLCDHRGQQADCLRSARRPYWLSESLSAHALPAPSRVMFTACALSLLSSLEAELQSAGRKEQVDHRPSAVRRGLLSSYQKLSQRTHHKDCSGTLQ